MRDIALLARTLRAIRDQGAGLARQVDGAPPDGSWFAGPTPLNGQAMRDLIEDGWLVCTPGRRQAVLDAWPSFADTMEAGHVG